MFIVWWTVGGLLAGLLTGKLMKGNALGSARDTLTGIAGAIIGGFIMRGLGFSAEAELLYAVLVAILGGLLLTFAVRMFLGRRTVASE